jgi:phospholipid-binding lipoprotein MlaA
VTRLARLSLVAFLVLQALPAAAERREYDPLERVNRGVFWFNDRLDVYLLEPVAKVWDFALPTRLRLAIHDAYDNALFPVDFINGLLQGKPRDAGTTLGRFLLNSTLGMAGLFDVAKAAGLPGRHEDFGQTLGVWGLGNGPYLVLPLLGPSTLRDACGRAVDSPMRVWPFFAGTVPSLAISSTEVVNWRSLHITEIRDLKRDAFDYYTLIRNAYIQNRKAAVMDHAAPPAAGASDAVDEDDLYFTDEEE